MRMSALKLKELSEKELTSLLGKTREELRVLSFQVANAELKEFSKMRKAKKLIARLLTVMSAKKREGLTKMVKSS